MDMSNEKKNGDALRGLIHFTLYFCNFFIMTSESKTMLQVIPSYFSLLLEVPGRSLIKTSL